MGKGIAPGQVGRTFRVRRAPPGEQDRDQSARLVKHLTLSEAGYFGAIFGRPSPEPIPSFDDPDSTTATTCGSGADESRAR